MLNLPPYSTKLKKRTLLSIENFLAVSLPSGFKFILGQIAGAYIGLPPHETAIYTSLGMFLSVILTTYSGRFLRRKLYFLFFQKRKIFSPRNRKLVKFWRKFGIIGVSFLSPVLFSPIGGTMIAVSFGEKSSKILIFMLLSGIFWSFGFAYSWDFFKNLA